MRLSLPLDQKGRSMRDPEGLKIFYCDPHVLLNSASIPLDKPKLLNLHFTKLLSFPNVFLTTIPERAEL